MWVFGNEKRSETVLFFVGRRENGAVYTHYPGIVNEAGYVKFG